MKARIKVICPICGVDLRTYGLVVNSNNASWALTESSTQNLEEAHK